LVRKRTGRWLFLPLVMILITLGFDDGYGQTTMLAVVPTDSTIYLNGSNSATITLYATGVENLMAYDVTVIYDPDIVHLDSFDNAGLLTPSFRYYLIDRPGFLRVAFGKVGAPGVYGDGPLLTLVFSGVGYGVTELSITDAGFSDPNGVVIHPAVQNGTIMTTYASTPVVTSSLSGGIIMQGRPLMGGIPVTLAQGLFFGNGPYNTFSLEQSGNNFFFDPLVMDAYPFTTNQPRYLNMDAAAGIFVGVLSTPTEMNPLVLLSGNAVWQGNNEINTEDLDEIRSTYGGLGSGLDADVNFDGLVNVQDLALAGGNYGLTSADAYSGWAP